MVVTISGDIFVQEEKENRYPRLIRILSKYSQIDYLERISREERGGSKNY